jgi:GNAT superfamily N-acetyltransferase
LGNDVAEGSAGVMRRVYVTSIADFTIRSADENDTDLILEFIRELAEYEGLLDEVVATREVLFDSLFVKHQAEVVIGEYRGKPVAFALFFHNFSTFLGKANLYLEDLFVAEEHRGRQFGKVMLACLATIATERGCERLDWWCLDWNERSIAFYKRMGAKPMSDWTVYRVEGQALVDLARTL